MTSIAMSNLNRTFLQIMNFNITWDYAFRIQYHLSKNEDNHIQNRHGVMNTKIPHVSML